jgi:SAM-dependent methyltransferase
MKGSTMSWDERFLRGDELHGYAPSPPLPQAIAGIAPGRALDLACGAGRHAIFLAERGWKVHAIDASQVGVQRMLDEAYKRRVSQLIAGEVADIESPRFEIEGEHDLVCDFYFLHRPLFAQIRRAVRPGGLFVAALHVRSAPREQGRFLLEPGELKALFSDWQVVHSREGAAPEPDHRHAIAELIARRVV